MTDFNYFVKLVSEMRKAQKCYFSTKHFSALYEAKKLEKQTDQALQYFLNEQETLFEKQNTKQQ